MTDALANGGVAGLLALGAATATHPDVLFPAFVGSMAAVAGDTWSTGLGALSRVRPRSIVSGRPVGPGTSGGVILLHHEDGGMLEGRSL